LVVERVTGVVLSRATVWRLLTGRLGWSHRRPERRAVERNESEIEASLYCPRSAAPTHPAAVLRSCGIG